MKIFPLKTCVSEPRGLPSRKNITCWVGWHGAAFLVVAIFLGIGQSKAHATLLGPGVTVDKLTDKTKWCGNGTQGGVGFVTGSAGDPMDSTDRNMLVNGGFPTNKPDPWNTYPVLFGYQTVAGNRISHVKVSICSYVGGTGLPTPGAASVAVGVGVADSRGERISSVAYSAAYVRGSTPYATSPATYSSITPVYTPQGAAVNGWQWYTMEVDLPATATSIHDQHVENFQGIGIGLWDGYYNSAGWYAPYIGTVELTVVSTGVAPSPASVTVIAPNGGNSDSNGGNIWNPLASMGPKYPVVSWNSNGLENLKIDLYKGGVFYKTMVANWPATFPYTTYSIDNTHKLGGDFSVRISSVTSPAVTDESDGYFKIMSVSSDMALAPTAAVQSNPPAITIKWDYDRASSSENYQVFRREMSSDGGGWGTEVSFGLAKDATSWTDTNVTPGVVYEYRLTRCQSQLNCLTEGYVSAGIDVPMTEDRGTVVLLVDATMTTPLANELLQMKRDLVGDGWKVIQHDVTRHVAGASSSVYSAVRDQVKADYAADPNVKAVYIIGHAPITNALLPFGPPDGHQEHTIWPGDAYYGDMLTPGWTGTNTVPLKLGVGRVDLESMTSFAAGETELLRQYLNKDHNWRHKLLTAQPRALMDDNFNISASMTGYMWTTLVGGLSKVDQADFMTTLKTTPYLLAYGDGGGTNDSCASVGTTAQFASQNPQAVFTSLFGSYFGDWNHPNNLLRAPLCTSTGLISFWGCRPSWYFHPMGMGQTTGYCTLVSENGGEPYSGTSNYKNTKRSDHMALMGDPTLRFHVVPPVQGLIAATINSQVHLSWAVPADPGILGYHVYRGTSDLGPFTRLTGGTVSTSDPSGSPISATTYIDTTATLGVNYKYMVRAVKNETGYVAGGGNYYNLSQGIFAGVNDPAPPAPQFANSGFELPALASGSFSILPTGTAWAFSGTSSGVSSNGSGYTSSNLGAPEGTQVGLIQMTGRISQTVGNLIPGFGYQIVLKAAQRSWNQQEVAVYIDGTLLSTLHPPNSTYQEITTRAFYPASSTCSVEFRGTNPLTGDNTMFLDNVRIQEVPGQKKPQSITFNPLAAKATGDAPATLIAVATSGLPVSFTSSNATVATVSDSMVTVHAPGTAVITAIQAGNATYNPATNVAQTLTVTGTAMQAWLAANSLPTDGTGLGAPGASPAGDGISNLMKYALGIDPWVSGYQTRLEHGTVKVANKDYLTLTYKCPEPPPAGVTCTVKTSPDLVSWSANETVTVSSPVDAGIRTTTVRDSISTQDATRRFIRLHADQ